ncbi:MAG: TRAP transporter large permease subunit, partial [Alphaproteobacteria bacterium]|nr:TRAP transporter large permease subunit [Alphaproteobacteria bacterium]
MTVAGTTLLKFLGLAFALLHIVQLAAFVLPSGQIRGLHVSGAVVIAALAIVVDAERRVWQRALAALGGFVALVPLVYLQLEHHALVSSRSVFANDTDIAIGVALVATLLLVTALEWRLIIPSLAALGLAYGHWGWWFDNELLNHGGLSFRRLVAYASIPSFRGALGDFAQISAYNLFMFMVFAGVLEATGGMDFIMRLSAAIGGRSRSGPAQVAVVSSGLQGMVSGSSVANVASSGVLTIPLMIKYGYTRPFAAAVEAVASNGGQITPPVMGVAAFLMVGLTGIPYGEIATAAILPAVVYFVHCAVGVQIATLKQGIQGLSAAEVEALRGPSLARDLLANAHLGFAVLFLVAALTYGLPEGNAALIATLTLLGLDVVKRLVFGRGSLADRLRACGRVVLDGLGNGAVQGAKIAIVVVTIGIFVE